VCGQVFHLAAIHPREEPDALMSARPDLCGGHRATSVPTAIVAIVRDRRTPLGYLTHDVQLDT